MKSKIDLEKDGKSITGRKDKQVFKQSLSRQEIKLASERNRYIRNADMKELSEIVGEIEPLSHSKMI